MNSFFVLYSILANYCDDAESNGCHPREPVPDGFDEIKSWMGPAPSLYVWNVGPNNSIPDTQCPDCEILGDVGWQFKITGFDVSLVFYHMILISCTLLGFFTNTQNWHSHKFRFPALFA